MKKYTIKKNTWKIGWSQHAQTDRHYRQVDEIHGSKVEPQDLQGKNSRLTWCFSVDGVTWAGDSQAAHEMDDGAQPGAWWLGLHSPVRLWRRFYSAEETKASQRLPKPPWAGWWSRYSTKRIPTSIRTWRKLPPSVHGCLTPWRCDCRRENPAWWSRTGHVGTCGGTDVCVSKLTLILSLLSSFFESWKSSAFLFTRWKFKVAVLRKLLWESKRRLWVVLSSSGATGRDATSG